MGRQKTIFHFSEHGIKLLKEFVNNRATQKVMFEMFKNPELAELIENENLIAEIILKDICTTLKITGKPDMQFIKDEYEYYKSLDRVNPGYENFCDNIKEVKYDA